jgi:hypothetical protein
MVYLEDGGGDWATEEGIDQGPGGWRWHLLIDCCCRFSVPVCSLSFPFRLRGSLFCFLIRSGLRCHRVKKTEEYWWDY